MKDLIEALQILLKYGDAHSPIHCEHDILSICCVKPSEVSAEDLARLEELGFYSDDNDDNDDNFYSFRFGSC